MRQNKHVGGEIERMVHGAEVAEAFGVPHNIGVRLWKQIGDVETLIETPRRELQEVKGVGPKTAERINPEHGPVIVNTTGDN